MSFLSKLRKGNGLTQKDVAKVFNVSRQALSNKERGLTPFTDSEKVIFVELIKPMFPNETVESIFFNENAKKYKE